MTTRLRPIGAPGDLITGIERGHAGARQTGAKRSGRGGVVETVAPGSPADLAGILPGDTVTSVNGHGLRDVVDYQFYGSEDVVTLDVIGHAGGAPRTMTLLRDTGTELGLVFTQPTFAPIRECNNHCPFCFIDQLPAEMRSSLYIRDDDYRYSFLYGNFVTLTNLNNRDWERLAEQHLSPLYVSVHATDLHMRRLLLGNDRAPDIRDQLSRLFDLGIKVHTQVVVCPGLNDGEILEQTLTDLAGYGDPVLSIGVVPVGLTRTPEEILAGPGASCSRLLPTAGSLGLRQMYREEAERIVALVESRQRIYRPARGKSLVYASDEIYLLADKPFPPASRYDGYPQYENGIGMVRDLLDDWTLTRRRITRSPGFRGMTGVSPSVSLVCGEMVAPVLGPLIDQWKSLRHVNAGLCVLGNTFFGPRVRVSGLLTARDVRAAGRTLEGDIIILPEVMLDKTGSKLLDGVTPPELESDLGKPVRFASSLGQVDRIVAGMIAA